MAVTPGRARIRPTANVAATTPATCTARVVPPRTNEIAASAGAANRAASAVERTRVESPTAGTMNAICPNAMPQPALTTAARMNPRGPGAKASTAAPTITETCRALNAPEPAAMEAITVSAAVIGRMLHSKRRNSRDAAPTANAANTTRAATAPTRPDPPNSSPRANAGWDEAKNATRADPARSTTISATARRAAMPASIGATATRSGAARPLRRSLSGERSCLSPIRSAGAVMFAPVIVTPIVRRQVKRQRL